MPQNTELREKVRERYANAATGRCCTDPAAEVDITCGTYSGEELAELPMRAASASLGCGNPTSVADLAEGETVLDLGSGGGIDVLLAAKRVGPTGFAYGLDMTVEMLQLARQNASEAQANNVEFLEGYIEDIPLPDNSIDVVISNCVINLSTDKPAVFSEIRRVLRQGGRIGITDVVADDTLTPDLRAQRGEWAGCIAGALSFSEYRTLLSGAGFTDISLTPTHEVTSQMYSVIVHARKAAS